MFTRGPQLYTVPGVNGVQIAAAGGVLGPITFVWPKPVFVSSILVATKAATRESLSRLRLQILDETQQQIIFDGKGGALANTSSSCFSLFGTLCFAPMFSSLTLLRAFKLQRPIAAGDNWLFTLRNDHPTDAVIPEITLGIEPGDRA